MNFVQVWLAAYTNPSRFADALRGKPAPHWGLYALVLRCSMDSLLIYLPAALMGRHPPTPSYVTFLPTENYFTTLIWLTPVIFIIQWLLGAGVMHVALRLRRLPSDIDQILNMTGMASLAIAAVLVLWDWLWFLIGGVDQYFLGVSHLVIDIWWFVLVVSALKKTLGVPVQAGIIVNALAFVAAMPFAIIFMRAPF